jgi:ribonucleotide reductase beta subunit family protein with ferritin-like domain
MPGPSKMLSTTAPSAASVSAASASAASAASAVQRSPFNSPLLNYTKTGEPSEPSELKLAEAEEPLLKENPNRHVIFPIEYPDIWAKYKQHMSVFWIPEEVDLSRDLVDWKEKLNDNERHFIKYVLAFFSSSDGIVMENLSTRFTREIGIPEAKFFYACQNMIESIHCVAPETKILTDKGYFEIKDLENQMVNVWNGEEFSEVKVVKTSENDKLIKVKLSNGMFLESTEEHKWFIRKGPEAHPETCKIEKVFTKDLKVGDVVGSYSFPVLDVEDSDQFLNPYTHGFFCGDGGYTNKYPQIKLYGEKQKLLPYLEVSSINPEPHLNKTSCYLTHKLNKDKFFVPINYSKKTKLEWLAGLLDADGTVKNSSRGLSAIQLGSINHKFLQDIQLMLSTLGVSCNIRVNKEERETYMPDGKGGQKLYKCKKIWCLYISLFGTHKLVELGFTPHRLILMTELVNKNPQLMRVEEIIDENRFSETYCFTEPKRHAGVFNGILTGQSETYSLMIDTYIDNKQEKLDTLRAVHTIPCIQKKAEWAMHWIESKEASFAQRLLGFAIVEGIFFSGAFCAIYWLKKRGLMPGLCQSNLLISRDEGLHTEFACLLYSKLLNKLAKHDAHKIIRDAVKIEKYFITKALPCELIGMNSKLMSEYIEFVADRLSVQLGYPKIYHAKNPFDFMEMISLSSKSNFFEARVTEYAKANTNGNPEEKKFAMDADF